MSAQRPGNGYKKYGVITACVEFAFSTTFHCYKLLFLLLVKDYKIQ